jgi:lysozyme family protein
MQASEAESMAHVFASEGGYTNDSKDPGGPTNFGITIVDARKYAAEFGWITGHVVTAADVKAMPKWFAEKVFDAKYWDALDCDDLPAGLDYALYDYGVNSGIARAGKVLRRLLGLSDRDWHVTAEVLAAVKKRKAADLINALDAERLAFLKSLSTWSHFGGGWGKRVASVNAIALHMAAQPTVNDNRPAPHVVQDNEVMAKAVRPAPSPVATATVSSAASIPFLVLMHAHPGIFIAVGIGSVAAAIWAAGWAARRAELMTEAATLGVAVVPIAAAAA